MDTSALNAIATTTVSLLVPYLKSMLDGVTSKTSEEIGKEVGASAWSKAKRIYEIITTKFSHKGEASKVINALKATPDDNDVQAAFRFHIKETMAIDEIFARELSQILKNVRSTEVSNTFQTTIHGNVEKLVEVGNVYGNVNL